MTIGIRLAIGVAATLCVGGGARAQLAPQWRVSASAGAIAYTPETYASQHVIVCNGTAYCAPPLVGPGADPVFYSHSDTDTTAVVNADATASNAPGSPYGPGSASGTAYAAVDLASGTLHVSNSGTQANYAASYSHGSDASFLDTLHFTSTSSQPVAFDIGVHVDGSFLGYQQPNLSFFISNAQNYSASLYQDWNDPSATEAACVGQVAGCSLIADQPANTTLSGDWTKIDEGDYILHFVVDPTYPDYLVSMALGAGGPGASYAAFEHTAGITFDLPAGVAFTSASGTFLTAADDVAAVPEPAGWATMVGGLGAIGGAVRRRRRRRRGDIAFA